MATDTSPALVGDAVAELAAEYGRLQAQLDQFMREAGRAPSVRRLVLQRLPQLREITEEMRGLEAQHGRDVRRQYRVSAGAANADLQARNLLLRPGFTEFDRRALRALVERVSSNLGGVRRALEQGLVLGDPRLAVPAVEAAIRGDNRLVASRPDGVKVRVPSGKFWDPTAYSRMLARTAIADARRVSFRQRYLTNGVDVVRVVPNGTTHDVCARWEGRLLSLTGATPGIPTVAEAQAAGLFHPQCFLESTPVAVSGPVQAASCREYHGQIVLVDTASGRHFRCTPNHPVLTPQGWIPAGLLDEGRRVVQCRGIQGPVGTIPQDQHVPSSIGQVYRALREAGGMASTEVPASPVHFHGDGGSGQVHVIGAHSLLGHRCDSAGQEALLYLLLACVQAPALLNTAGAARQAFDGSVTAAHGGVRRASQALALLGVSSLHALAHDGGAVTRWGAGIHEGPADSLRAHSEVLRELRQRHPGQVVLDQVRRVRRAPFRGHVYNLQAADSYYTADGIVVHNCRHRYVVAVGEVQPEDAALRAAALQPEPVRPTLGFRPRPLGEPRRLGQPRVQP